MAYTYQFQDHLREHRPSRLGQRLWWMPAVAGVALAIADGVYLAATPSGHLSSALAVPPLFIAAMLFLVAWAALSIADWTYRRRSTTGRRSTPPPPRCSPTFSPAARRASKALTAS